MISLKWSFAMLPRLFIGPDADRLTWEYLDGEITPPRAQLLSKMLAAKAAARQRFVESAVLHGMLFEYFKNEASNSSDEQGEGAKRRKRGRTSAA